MASRRRPKKANDAETIYGKDCPRADDPIYDVLTARYAHMIQDHGNVLLRLFPKWSILDHAEAATAHSKFAKKMAARWLQTKNRRLAEQAYRQSRRAYALSTAHHRAWLTLNQQRDLLDEAKNPARVS